jgi:hypothetical protein
VRAVRALDSPALQRLWGWELSSWTYNARRGIVFFVHHDAAGEATDVVIAVNAPEGERAAFEPVLERMSLPARPVCVADGGDGPRSRTTARLMALYPYSHMLRSARHPPN